MSRETWEEPNAFVRRAGVRDVVLSALALACLAAAGLIFYSCGTGEEAAPTDPSSYVYFVCEGCGEFFHLNGQEIDQAYKRNEFARSADGRTMVFKCPKCGQMKAVRAAKCPQHGEIVKSTPGPNDPVKCTKCEFRGG